MGTKSYSRCSCVITVTYTRFYCVAVTCFVEDEDFSLLLNALDGKNLLHLVLFAAVFLTSSVYFMLHCQSSFYNV